MTSTTSMGAINLVYDASKTPPSNVEKALEAAHNNLVEVYSAEFGGFIKKGAYHVFAQPVAPNLSTIAGELEKRVAGTLHEDECKSIAKQIRGFAIAKPRMYVALRGVLKGEAFDRCEKDSEWAALDLAENDPLKLALLMRRALNSTVQEDADGKVDWETAVVNYKQGSKTLTEYRDGLKNLLLQGKAMGLPDPVKDSMMRRFLKGLSPKYKGLVDSMRNELQPYPEDWQGVLAKAEKWTVPAYSKPDSADGIALAALAAAFASEDAKEISLALAGMGLKPHAEKLPKPPAVHKAQAAKPTIGAGEKAPRKERAAHFSVKHPNPATKEVVYDCKTEDGAMKATFYGHCTDCGKSGHGRFDCPEKGSTGGVALAVQIEYIDEETTCALREALIHPDFVGEDTLSSCHIASNPELLSDIHITTRRVRVNGLNGTILLDKVGTMAGVGSVYFWEGGTVNLVSVGKMVRDGAKRTLLGDSDIFEFSDGTVMVFRRQTEATSENAQLDLYLCDTREDEVAFAVHAGTVEENERLYTTKEVEDSEKAMRQWKNQDYPGLATYLKMLRHGTIRGVRSTEEDLRRGIRIRGRPLEIIRGKTKNSKVHVARPVPIVRTLERLLVMRIDIMFVNGVMFLVSIVKPLLLGMVNYIKRKTAAVVYIALRAMMSAYVSAGFTISDIVCDGEGAISKLRVELEEKGTRVHVAGKGTHVPEPEERVRTYKEGVRGNLNSLPYVLPFCLLIHLVYYVVSRRNMVPHSAAAEFIPPIETFRCRPVDCEKDTPLAFGAYCEVFEQSDNTMASRTRPGMFLNSTGTESGTMLFVMLDTWKLARSDRWEEKPVDAAFIAAVDKKAAAGKTMRKDPEVLFNDRVVLCDDEAPPTGLSERPVRRGTEVIADYDPNVEPELQLLESDGSIEAETHLGDNIASTSDAAEPAGDLVMVNPDIFARAARGVPLPLQVNGGLPELPSSEEEKRGVRHSLPGESRGAQVPSPTVEDYPASLEQLTEREEPVKAESTHGHSLRPKRSSGLRDGRWQERSKGDVALKVSLARGQERYGDEADRAAMAEVTGIHDKGVFEGVHWKSLSIEDKKRVIISQLFLKEKFMSTGDFEKLKARLVAGGHMQDKDSYSRDETSAPTVSLTGVNLVAAIAAYEGRHVMTMDVPQAFLNGDMKRDVLMRIEPALAKLMCEIPGSHYAKYIRPDGSLIVRLKKALYGTLEAAKIWFEVLKEFLLGLGFKQNAKDQCVFNKLVDDVQLTVAVYVDDAKCTCKQESALVWIADAFNSRFPGMSITRGAVHSFLGQTWDYSKKGKVSVTMEGNIGQMVDDYGVGGSAVTPAADDVFQIDSESPLLIEDRRARFHSFVQRCAWVSKRVVPQLGPALSFLMPRVYKATEQDEGKLDRVMKYLNANSARGIVIEPSATGLYLHAYVDASFGVHEDMKSHTGSNISLGKGPVFTSSTKQKQNGLSSTEVELIGLADSLSQVLWVRDFLIEQGHAIGPAVVYQDNQSTIKLAERGSAASQRTRHIAIRFFFVHDRMASGEIAIEYMPTGHMLADILTKPLQGSLYRRLRGALTNWYEPGEREDTATVQAKEGD